jgi:phosphonate transport system substrate-binding protein
MWRTVVKTIVLLGLLSPLLGCQGQEQPEKTVVDNVDKTITIGDISDERIETQQKLQPIADYLAANLKDVGISQGQVKVVSELETMPQFISSGEIDLYMDSPYPAMFVVNRAGAQPILRRWKDGVAEYNTIFIVRKDSKIKSIGDLVGKTIAFDEFFSSSGYMFPMAYLLQAKFKPIPSPSSEHKWQSREIGYQFSGSDERTIEWVLKGEIDAGTIDNGIFSALPKETRDRLRIIAQTEKFPRHVVVVRPGMNPQELEQIKTVLINMDKTKEGKTILKNFDNTIKFDDLSGENQEVLLRLQSAYNLVEEYRDKQ